MDIFSIPLVVFCVVLSVILSNPKTPIIIAGTIITKGIIRITIKWRKK